MDKIDKFDRDVPEAATCGQFEAWLADALDGALSGEASRRFQFHADGCAACGAMLSEVRQGMSWLRMLEEPQPPQNLMHNILAATSSAPVQRPAEAARGPEWLESGWLGEIWAFLRPVAAGAMHPRFAASFSMAFFSLSLTLGLLGVKVKDLAHMDLRPASVRRAAVLQYTQIESRVVRYYENLRLVYEIESRVSELKRAADSPQDHHRQPEQPQRKNRNDHNDTSGRPKPRQDQYSRERDDRVVADAGPGNPPEGNFSRRGIDPWQAFEGD